MAKLKSESLGELLRQAHYSPENQRIIQIDACEALLHLVQPGRNYPFEFVCFHLTGYRPKRMDDPELLSYDTLVHDLPAYGEKLSLSVRISYIEAGKGRKVYTVESLARQYRISDKTISRWRCKGLVGRYMIFPDGRKRLGFLSSSVDWFVKQNRVLVDRSKNFSHISAREKADIVKRLQRWSELAGGCRQEAIRRTARYFERSAESIRTILVEHEHKTDMEGKRELFGRRASEADLAGRLEIFKDFEQGFSVPDLMKKYGRSRSNIYHCVNVVRAERLMALDIEYIRSAEFEREGAEEELLTDRLGVLAEVMAGGVENKGKSLSAVNSLATYVRDICTSPLLTARQERAMFARYNYLKYRASQWQREIDVVRPSARLLADIKRALHEAEQLKNQLIRCNLRLVVSSARKHTRYDNQMMEMISEGNLALLNSVEKFDYSRGVRFSTYATWAIVRQFAGYWGKVQNQAAINMSDEMLEIARDLRMVDSRVLEVESARRSLEEVMADTLEQREHYIVTEHYGLTDERRVPEQRKGRSLSQIGEILGISKERVRQVELIALQKLRKAMTVPQFEALVGG